MFSNKFVLKICKMLGETVGQSLSHKEVKKDYRYFCIRQDITLLDRLASQGNTFKTIIP